MALERSELFPKMLNNLQFQCQQTTRSVRKLILGKPNTLNKRLKCVVVIRFLKSKAFTTYS